MYCFINDNVDNDNNNNNDNNVNNNDNDTYDGNKIMKMINI